MSRAICIIRSSQGGDAKQSLQYQRREVPQLARSLVEAGEDETTDYRGGGRVEVLDLGIHTGFSTFERNPDRYDGELLDENDRVQQVLSEIEEERYDYIVARNQQRIARDEFFAFFKRAARGTAEFAFTDDDADVGSLSADVTNLVERKQKLAEIQASKQAIQDKQEAGEPLGRPPYGLTYTEDKTEYTLGENFEDVEQAFRLRKDDASYSKIIKETGIARGTLSRMFNENRETYNQFLGD